MHSVSEYTEETRVIVIEIGSKKIGLIVDEISEVIMIPTESIAEAYTIKAIESEYLLGVAKILTLMKYLNSY